MSNIEGVRAPEIETCERFHVDLCERVATVVELRCSDVR